MKPRRHETAGLRERLREVLDEARGHGDRVNEDEISAVIDAVLGVAAPLESDGQARDVARWASLARAVREDDRCSGPAGIERVIGIVLSSAYAEGKRDGALESRRSALLEVLAMTEGVERDAHGRAVTIQRELLQIEEAKRALAK